MFLVDDDETQPLTPADLEIELGRLALAVGSVRNSAAVWQARRQGRPHPGIEAFLRHCTRLMQRTPPERQDALVKRLDRLALHSGLGIVGLEAWLTDPMTPATSSGFASDGTQRSQAPLDTNADCHPRH